MNRMNPRYEFGVWLGVSNKCAESFGGAAEGVLGLSVLTRFPRPFPPVPARFLRFRRPFP